MCLNKPVNREVVAYRVSHRAVDDHFIVGSGQDKVKRVTENGGWFPYALRNIERVDQRKKFSGDGAQRVVNVNIKITDYD